MTYGPPSEIADLREEGPDSLVDRGRLVRRGGRPLQEPERRGTLLDRAKHAVVLRGELTDLGVGLDPDRS